MVRLQIPSNAWSLSLLARRRLRLSASEEDNLILCAGEQVIFSGKAGKDVGKERIVVDLVSIRESCCIENVER